MPAPSGKADRPLDRAIVLVGFMAAGKSRIGRILAERLKLPFADTDRIIEEIYGAPIAQIFEKRGETEFRIAERELISRILSEDPRVISVGGGAFVNSATRDELNRRARTIWLDAPFEPILARLRRSAGRPLALDKSEAEIRELWEERRQFYAQAHLRIETRVDPQRTVEQVIREIR